MIEKYELKNIVCFLCAISGVSHSGYYNYLSSESQKRRKQREKKDLILNVNILYAFQFKYRKKVTQQIRMTLEGQFQITYNLMRTQRIMRKYKIVCPIRKTNPYQKMLKATKEHAALPNLLTRKFIQEIPGDNGQMAYLSTILDS